MKFLFWLAQIAITLLASTTVALWMGVPYAVVAALVFIGCSTLLYEHARLHSQITKAPVGYAEALGLIGTSFVFGMIWPTIPVIIALKVFGPIADENE